MRILALDLSKRSTGWACWSPNDQHVASGIWDRIGSEFTSLGRVFCNLHVELSALNDLGKIDAIFYEEPLDPRTLSGHTNIDTLRVLNGMAMHVESWGDAMSVKIVRSVHMVSWRRHFLGSIPRPKLKDSFGNKTGESPIDWKALAIAKCRELGFETSKHDEAEAIGILSFACHSQGLNPDWTRKAP